MEQQYLYLGIGCGYAIIGLSYMTYYFFHL